MAAVRTVKNKDYSIVHNGFINNKNLSFKAKGLLLYFLSKPDKWEFYIKEIAKNSKDGVESISSGIKELEDNGYIHKNFKRNKDGKLSGGYDFTVYEEPQPKQEKTETVKNLSGNLPIRENPALINTELISNTNNKKEKRKTEFDELINQYTENEKLRDTIYEFIKHRKSIKSALTTLALKKIITKLNILAKDDNTKIAILENSIMNGWRGVFPLGKDDNVIPMKRNETPTAPIEIDKSKLGGI